MSPVAMLLLALLALYLCEFLVWVRPDVRLFHRRGRGWVVAARDGLLSTPRGSLHWVYPIPGFGRVYCVPCTRRRERGAAASDRLESHEVGDPREAIERQRQRVGRALQPLQWLAWGMMSVIGIVAPVVFHLRGSGPVLHVVAPGLVLLMVSNAWVLHRIHRRLFPASDDERMRLVLSACLSPMAAIRSADLAQKWALDEFHPLAVAAALPGFEGWEEMAAELWRRLKFAESAAFPDSDSEPSKPSSENAAVMAEIEALARLQGVDPATWAKPPARLEPSNSWYCPRCRSQFTRTAARCHDCNRSGLLPIPE